jgi:NitT/TauT family transport system substrate-binding protein
MIRGFCRLGVAIIALGVVACGSDDDGDNASGGKTRPKLTLAINPAVMSYLPLFVAVDKGYFDDAGVDVELVRYAESANTQIPLLARGDIDVATAVPGPALFNQFTGGFNLKIIGGLSEAKEGHLDEVTMVVGRDVADEISEPEDLRGRKVDIGAEGSPIHFVTGQLLEQAGLTGDDVTLSDRGKTLPDQQLSLKNKAVDVQGSVEPAGSIMEGEGIGSKWLGQADIVPGWQPTLLAASESAVAEKSEALELFLRGYLRAVQDVSDAGPQWTDELVRIAEKWTEAPAELIRATGAPPFAPPDGAVDVSWLERSQEFWAEEGLVEEAVDVNKIIDIAPLERARADAGE